MFYLFFLWYLLNQPVPRRYWDALMSVTQWVYLAFLLAFYGSFVPFAPTPAGRLGVLLGCLVNAAVCYRIWFSLDVEGCYAGRS